MNIHKFWEITITIGTAILMKNNKKLCYYIRAIFYINCDYNFNPCGIFESMTSLTPFFNQDWNKEINGGRKFSEIKVQKT